MIDHLGIPVSDIQKSKRFYSVALAPLGVSVQMEGPYGVGFGKNGKPDFWIVPGTPAKGIHVAFTSEDRATVDAFHSAALAAGARDNGAPGLRPHYHANYYGAFVYDPDGYNVEAVCHKP